MVVRAHKRVTGRMIESARAGRTIAASCLLLAAMSGAVRCARIDLDEMTYRIAAASRTTIHDGDSIARNDGAEDPGANSPAIIGWLDIEKPELSYPVVQPRGDTPRSWYLDHDAWGDSSELGCPYLDIRATTAGEHLLVYGHRIFGSDAMFSQLADAYLPDVFYGLGDARWHSRDGRRLSCTPLLAMRVQAAYRPIQRFDFSEVADLRAWLRRLTEDASAVSHTAEALISSSTAVVTLVTCSGDLIGSDWRTLVVYVAR